MTSGIWIEDLDVRKATVSLKNRKRVQNHIGGVHACGMALLAESATGELLCPSEHFKSWHLQPIMLLLLIRLS
jgi:hypothetical protein